MNAASLADHDEFASVYEMLDRLLGPPDITGCVFDREKARN